MSAKTVAELAIDVETHPKDAVAGFDAVGDASKQMARDVDASAESTKRSLGITADAADDLGGKAGKATGALGALSSGFELLGPSGAAAATGLQSAALATDFLSGVGDSLNLVMESTIVKNVRQRAATLASAAASGFAAVKTGVMTAAQWALNAAMDANPIGLVVLAVAALAAGFIIAYKKSETFREIVHVVTDAVVGYFKLITLPMRTLIGVIGDIVKKIPGLSTGFHAVATTAKAVGSAILSPFKAVYDVIEDIIDAIGKIKLPHISKPDLNPFSRAVTPGRTTSDTSTPTVINNINLNGLLTDRDGVRLLEQLLDRKSRRTGWAIA